MGASVGSKMAKEIKGQGPELLFSCDLGFILLPFYLKNFSIH